MTNLIQKLLVPFAALGKAHQDKKIQEGGAPTNVYVYVGYLLNIAVSCFCVYLSWKCSVKDSMPARILLAIVAFLFGYLYLIYYGIYHTLLKYEC